MVFISIILSWFECFAWHWSFLFEFWNVVVLFSLWSAICFQLCFARSNWSRGRSYLWFICSGQFDSLSFSVFFVFLFSFFLIICLLNSSFIRYMHRIFSFPVYNVLSEQKKTTKEFKFKNIVYMPYISYKIFMLLLSQLNGKFALVLCCCSSS